MVVPVEMLWDSASSVKSLLKEDLFFPEENCGKSSQHLKYVIFFPIPPRPYPEIVSSLKRSMQLGP